MKSVNSIDRSFQNHKNEVVETDVPKSGQNLTYRNHNGGLVLGRLYPQSFQHLMPNDKISGSNEANLTFEQLATPVVDDVDVCVHNFLVTLRSIDNRWEKFMTPTKLNQMNKNVSTPTFNLQYILASIVDTLSNFVDPVKNSGRYGFNIDLRPLKTFNAWDYVYHSDAIHDLYEQLCAIMGYVPETSFPVFEPCDTDDLKANLAQFFLAIFDFFVGKRSLLDYFGYNMISRDEVLAAFSDDAYFNTLDTYIDNASSLNDWLYDYDNLLGGISTFLVVPVSGTSAPRTFDNEEEYSLRAYYAIWFEYYRNYDLEPRSSTLPEYRDFGATSIFGYYVGNPPKYMFTNLHFLIPRIRSWQQDAFTTAGIDDISRHVFAPLLDGFSIENTLDSDLQPSGILDNNTIIQTLKWRDPSSGVVSSVDVPVPTRLVSALQQPSNTINAYGLELFSLRKAQMLENYLKRIYYGGDEYRDRMLHLYGARIEDYRINRPQWLSSSIDYINPKQEVANTGVAPGSPSGWSAGSRLATATAVQSGNDGFTEFCPEFGVYISMLSIMPHATYDPYIMQNLQTKYSDFPIPQFANQMEDVISTREISRRVAHNAFGYAPYAHAYRYRVDEVHGDYHDDKYDYVFLRFFDADNIPNLSWSFIHCRPKLPMFVDTVLLDGQVYGTFKHNFLVERPLPSPVETI